jgi:hypothetical protein
LPFLHLADHALNTAMLAVALFVRGVGQSAVGLPSMSAAYASVNRDELPMATTSLNIVQRLGGPTFTTLCAALLGWRLAAPASTTAALSAYAWAFVPLCALHAATAIAAARLPRTMDDVLKLRST